MRTLSSTRWLAVAVPVLALAACGGAKKDAYIEKPVDDLYNQAMDQMVEERYAESAKTFEQVESQHPYSVWATKGQLMAAYALYEAGN
ncbi:MAG TPA: outer membrane protein assembly factor BamD, partial [Stellaceae bacterium]|nr:outer membrane protein assembly factor BamD [Stellaceae bacterium]